MLLSVAPSMFCLLLVSSWKLAFYYYHKIGTIIIIIIIIIIIFSTINITIIIIIIITTIIIIITITIIIINIIIIIIIIIIREDPDIPLTYGYGYSKTVNFTDDDVSIIRGRVEKAYYETLLLSNRDAVNNVIPLVLVAHVYDNFDARQQAVDSILIDRRYHYHHHHHHY